MRKFCKGLPVLFALLFILIFPSVKASAAPIKSKIEYSNHENSFVSVAGNDSGTFVAVGSVGFINVSKDGTNWTKVDSKVYKPLNKVVYLNNKFFAVGYNGSITISDDGTSWTRVNSDTTANLQDITYGNGMYVAVGCNFGTIITSQDGINWTKQVLGFMDHYDVYYSRTYNQWYGFNSILFNNNLFLAAGDYGTIAYSRDGVKWEKANSNTEEEILDIKYCSNKYIAAYSGNTHIESMDGISWNVVSHELNNIKYIFYADDTYVMYGPGGIITSKDGAQWNTASLEAVYFIKYFDHKFYASLYNGTILSSPDAVTWSITYLNTDKGVDLNYENTFRDMAFSNNTIVAIAKQHFAVSQNGVNWNTGEFVAPFNVPNNSNTEILDILFENNLLVALRNNEIVVSRDGLNWETAYSNNTPGSPDILYNLYYCGSKYFAVGQEIFLTSDDGLHWNIQRFGKTPNGDSPRFRYVSYGNGIYVLTGDYSQLLYSQDGESWNRCNANGLPVGALSVSYNNGIFVAAEENTSILTSLDGISWDKLDTTSSYYAKLLVCNNMFFISDNKKTLYSKDGNTWNIIDNLNNIKDIIFVNNEYYALSDYSILASSDLSNWSRVYESISGSFNSIIYYNNTFIASGERTEISDNGVDWKYVYGYGRAAFHKLISSNDKFWAIGADSISGTVSYIENNEDLKILSVYPKDSSMGVPLGSTIQIEFNKPIKLHDIYQIQINGLLSDCIVIADDNDLFINTKGYLNNFSTMYSIIIPRQVIASEYDEVMPEDYTLQLTTMNDIYPPVFESIYPSDNPNGIGLDTFFSIYFNEAISKGTNYSDISLKDDAGNIAPIGKFTEGNMLSIYPNSQLKSLTEYTLTIPRSSIADTSGNMFESELKFNYKTIDGTPPNVISTSPLDSTYDAQVSEDIVITFDEPVFSESLQNITLKYDNYYKVTCYPKIEDNKLIIKHDKLDYSTIYKLSVPANTIHDSVGQYTPKEITIWFRTYTPDTESPEILAAYPAPDASNVPCSTDIKLLFSENIQPGDNYNGFTLLDSSYNTIPTSTTTKDSRVIIKPSGLLKPGAKYTLYIPQGCINDTFGNPLKGDYALSFKTSAKDTSPPSVKLTEPKSNAKDIYIDTQKIYLYFSEAIYEGSEFPKVSLKNSRNENVESDTVIIGDTLIFNLKNQLNYGEKYTVIVPKGSITDSVENATVKDYTFSFTTYPRPYVTKINLKTMNVKVDTKIQVDFSKYIAKPYTRSYEDTHKIELVNNATKECLLLDGNVKSKSLYIDLPKYLMPNTSYTLILAHDTVTDTSAWKVGLGEDYTFSFTTENKVYPIKVLKTYPLNKQKDADINKPITVAFSQNIMEGTNFNKITLFSSKDKLTNHIGRLEIDNNQSNVLSINPEGLVPGETYALTIPDGAVTDENGVTFKGSYSLTFTAAIDKPTLAVKSSTPKNKATNIKNTAPMVVTFNRNIQLSGNRSKIEFYSVDNNGETDELDTTDVKCTIFGSTLSIDYSAIYNYSSRYLVIIPADYVIDMAGNPMISDYSFSFTTEIRKTGLVIMNVDTGISDSTSKRVSFEFNRPIDVVDLKYITIKDHLNNELYLYDEDISFEGENGNIIVFDLSRYSVENTRYVFTFKPGAFIDPWNNKFASTYVYNYFVPFVKE